MKKVMMAAGFVFVVVLLAGCAQKAEEAKSGAAAPEVTDSKAGTQENLVIRTPKKEELGKDAVCPVMTDMKFKVSKTTPVIDYKGKAYFFCCNNCPDEFKKNPAKFVK